MGIAEEDKRHWNFMFVKITYLSI